MSCNDSLLACLSFRATTLNGTHVGTHCTTARRVAHSVPMTVPLRVSPAGTQFQADNSRVVGCHNRTGERWTITTPLPTFPTMPLPLAPTVKTQDPCQRSKRRQRCTTRMMETPAQLVFSQPKCQRSRCVKYSTHRRSTRM